ncbi:MAG: ribonuclease HII [Pseudomonadota bacterium]
MLGPHFHYEDAAIHSGTLRVAGVDEVGRGPLAGPVTAAAVILDPDNIPYGINDSKKLSLQKREALYDVLMDVADVSVAHASVEEVDKLNILQASFLAMRRAIDGLRNAPNLALIDGSQLPNDMPCEARSIVKGDTISVSIAAASIIAKVTRDRIMWDLAQQFPGYGWETNAGYGSKSHMKALEKLGATPHHRRSFKPVHNILYQEKT